jgi:hypothetical protein
MSYLPVGIGMHRKQGKPLQEGGILAGSRNFLTSWDRTKYFSLLVLLFLRIH